jgi:hypothetical protein
LESPQENVMPKDPFVYTETGVWFDQENAPEDRLGYPSAPTLFTTDPKSNYVIIKKDYRTTVEFAKYRSWFWANNRLDFKPGRVATSLELNGKPLANRALLPSRLQKEIERYSNKISSLRESSRKRNR